MLTLDASQATFSAGDQITFTFTFENTYGAGGTIISETYFASVPSVALYGSDRVSTCTINGSSIRWGNFIDIAYGDVLVCTFPYTATASDAASGEIRASVTLDAPAAGSTVSNEVVILAN